MSVSQSKNFLRFNTSINFSGLKTPKESACKTEEKEAHSHRQRSLNRRKTGSIKSIFNKISLFETKSSGKMSRELLKEKIQEIIKDLNEERNSLNAKKKKKKNNLSYKLKKLQSSLPKCEETPRILPLIQSQDKFNKYLINDFRDNFNEKDYIKRSLKYREVNDIFESELSKMNYKKNKTLLDSELMKETFMFLDRDIPCQGVSNIFKMPFVFDEKEVKVKESRYNKKPTIKNDNKEVVGNLKGKNSDKQENAIKENVKNMKYAAVKNAENIKENAPKNNVTQSSLMKSPKNLKPLDLDRESKAKELAKKKQEFAQSILKKYNRYQDNGYHITEQLYKRYKNTHDKFVKDKQKKRATIFSKEIMMLEKEKYMFPENFKVDENTQYPYLNEGELTHQLNLKRVKENSYNTVVTFNEGDHDLDLDNINMIKNNRTDMEYQMILTLKDKDTIPSYIKKKLNLGTVNKFKSTSGIYFGK